MERAKRGITHHTMGGQKTLGRNIRKTRGATEGVT